MCWEYIKWEPTCWYDAVLEVENRVTQPLISALSFTPQRDRESWAQVSHNKPSLTSNYPPVCPSNRNVLKIWRSLHYLIKSPAHQFVVSHIDGLCKLNILKNNPHPPWGSVSVKSKMKKDCIVHVSFLGDDKIFNIFFVKKNGILASEVAITVQTGKLILFQMFKRTWEMKTICLFVCYV